MNDTDLLEFITKFNEQDTQFTTALEFILFMDKAGFAIYKKRIDQ